MCAKRSGQQFAGNVLMVGCGSIGQTVLPLVLRELGLAGTA